MTDVRDQKVDGARYDINADYKEKANDSGSGNENEGKKRLKKKKGGIFRWGAIVPFLILFGLVYAYFYFFLDSHLKKAIEIGGYQVLGVEVNVGDLKTSFTEGSLVIKKIEITDSEKPELNAIEIGLIKFDILWDALLRAKFVVETAKIEEIKIGSARKKPGKVKPPEPKKEGPSFLEKEAEKTKGRLFEELADTGKSNVLGDIVSILSGSSIETQLKSIEEALPSKKKIIEFQNTVQTKRTDWDKKIKQLPQPADIQKLSDRLSKVKTKDFKDINEVQNSIKEADAVFKEADGHYKNIQKTSDEFTADLNLTKNTLGEIEGLIKKDISDLETRFKIPKIEFKDLAKALLMPYVQPYLNKLETYKGYVEKYIPEKYKNKNAKKEEEKLTPHPRAKGISYEFGRPNSYPMFWLKQIKLNSALGASVNQGEITGEIKDITSNQVQIKRPTTILFNGNFPGLEVLGVNFKSTIDYSIEDIIKFDLKINSIAISEKTLIGSADANVKLKKAFSEISVNGVLDDFKNLELRANNTLNKTEYEVSAKEKLIDEILKNSFARLPALTIDANASGVIPRVGLSLNSNLGPELGRALEGEVKKKIDEARKQIETYVQGQIKAERAKLDAKVNEFKSQIESEINKIRSMVDKEKQKAEQQVNAAKKQAEDSGKKAVEDQLKKSLGDDAAKKLEELKKKINF